MKQVKVLMLALTVLMGIGFTSCLKGDDNPIRQQTFIVRSTLYGTAFKDASGMVLEPTVPQVLNGDMYQIYCQYDQSQIAAETKSIPVTLLADAVCIDGPRVSSDVVTPNAPIKEINPYSFVFFDSKTLIVSTSYWVKKEATSEAQAKELSKHSIVLAYNPASITDTSVELVFTLNHKIADEEGETIERTNYTEEIKSYNLSSALADFRNKTGKLPATIIVEAQMNTHSNALDKAQKVKVDMQYNFKE